MNLGVHSATHIRQMDFCVHGGIYLSKVLQLMPFPMH